MEKYAISTGRSRTETKWEKKETTWAQLVQRLAKVKRTDETADEYRAMSKDARGRVKDCGGFVGGTLEGEQRKASAMRSRSLVTLDIDYGQADTLDTVDDALFGTAWALYSTHSHTPEAPRYRLILPLSREVTPEEYLPIARRIAENIGIDIFDDSTYEPSRLMYWPSASKDAPYVFQHCEGLPVDADAVLASFADWRNPAEWPISRRITSAVTGRGAKQEDPRTKAGLIGAFCRTYGIAAAIETFLPDVYTPTDREDRYTFAEGTTAGGLVVYDDLWAFSHHATDPCGSRLCNAFDLVRIHRFGAQDVGASPDTPVGKLPSFQAMEALILKDTKTTERRALEGAEGLRDDIAGLMGEGAEGEEETPWQSRFRLKGKTNQLQSCPYNFGLIVRNDPKLCRAVWRDAFRGRDVVVSDLPWRPADRDPFWNNSDDAGLIDYVSTVYQLEGKQALLDAQDLAVSQRAFHPVREYLLSLKWDGVQRLDTLLVDYLGALDNELTRAMTRKHFTGAVARIIRPGCKYDTVLTLVGPEGIGKSTLIKILGRDWFDDSLTSIEGKEAMEQIRGKWLIEMGELTNYKRSTSEAYKAFISKQEDSFRPAYGRKTEIYPRQCVFFATTNERNFLKGDTGNRRFWTVECGVDLVTRNVWEELPDEVDQIWAEALHYYRQGEALYLPPQLERDARERQAEANELSADERAGRVQEFYRAPVPKAWADMTLRQRLDYLSGGGPGVPEEMIQRETITAIEVLAECFGERLDEKTRYKTRELNQILRRCPDLEEIGRVRIPFYGRQWAFKIRPQSLG